MSDRGRDDLASALRQLAQTAEVPPLDPDRERALLEAFDAAQQEKRAPAIRAGVWRPAAAATLLAVAATMAWVIVGRSGRPPAPRAVAPLTTTEFVLWPGAAELPTFESGHLMRMEVPVSALPSLGLVPPATHAAVVQADVLVGQDGLPRAVRLSPDF
jgi:hypothetical protein